MQSNQPEYETHVTKREMDAAVSHACKHAVSWDVAIAEVRRRADGIKEIRRKLPPYITGSLPG